MARRPLEHPALACAVALIAGLLTACQDAPQDRTPGRAGSSIALLRDGKRLAIVDPDHGSVSILDADSLALLGTIDVGGEPHQLLELADGRLVVATYRGGELVVVDADSAQVVQRRAVCAGPWGLALAPNQQWLAVSCEWQGVVLRADATTLATVPVLAGLHRPRAVAVQGDTVWAADFAGPDARVWHGIGSEKASVRLVPPALPTLTPSQVAALLPMPDGRVWVAWQLVQNGAPAVAGVPVGYGALIDGNPRINPSVAALSAQDETLPATPVTYARYDGGSRAFNAPSALAALDDRLLLVAHLSSNDVAVLDTKIDGEARVLARLPAGAGPRGVAIDRQRRTVWIDNALDASVTRLRLDSKHSVLATTTQIRPLPAHFSPAALAGRRAFHDATNAHLTPLGVVACSTCHPDGGDDGLVWFLHADKVTPRHRRTMHLAGTPPDAKMLHWDGEFADLHALLEVTVGSLLGGDGLLLDSADFAAYIAEMVIAPVGPLHDAAAVARGKSLFEQPNVGCANCHEGPELSDGLRHAVLSPMSLEPADPVAMTRTPSLRGVFLRAPYFHDGRSPDLHDLHRRSDLAGHGHAADLTGPQLDDLVTYLKTL